MASGGGCAPDDAAIDRSAPAPASAHPDRSTPADRALALVAACARPLADPGRVAAITRAAASPLDADAVATLAHRHRVEGFVEQGLAAAGIVLAGAAAARLTAGAGAARLQVLRNAGEELRVGRALAAAGIDTVFVKGATLGMRAHGMLTLKSSWDIDVLIARAHLDDAGLVLRDLGYRLSIFGGIDDPVQVRRFLAGNKETEWHHAGRGTTVELHTALTDNPVALPSVGLGSPRQTVALMPGQALSTLATVPLFAYLAYHGTAHLWSRLKWLADVAAVLRDEDVVALHAHAVALGAGRTPGVAIVLAHEILGLDVPPALLATIRADRVTQRLIAYSHAAIVAAQDAEGRLMRPFGEHLAYARAQGWLMPGAAHRWYAARRFVTRPYIAAHLRVPHWALPFAILGALPGRLLLRPIRLRQERRQAGGNTASRP